MCKVSFLSGPCVMAECCSTTFPPRVAVLILGIVNMMRYCAMIMLWVCVQLLSCVQLFETRWTVTHQAPLSLGFSRQEYWSGLLFPSPGDLPDPGLLHCRQILYRLSYLGSPCTLWQIVFFKNGHIDICPIPHAMMWDILPLRGGIYFLAL